MPPLLLLSPSASDTDSDSIPELIPDTPRDYCRVRIITDMEALSFLGQRLGSSDTAP